MFKLRISYLIRLVDRLQDLRRFLLVTEDAQGVYGRYGFQPLGEETAHWLQIFNS